MFGAVGRDNDRTMKSRFNLVAALKSSHGLRRRVVALLLMVAAMPADAGSMRCGSRLVGEGDLAAELLAACGEPALRDPWSFQLPRGGYVADIEQWVYDFGPSQLLKLVRLRDGRIVEFETDGYGFPPESGSASPRRCEPRLITQGLSKYRLLRSCGEPLTRRAENVLKPLYARPEIYRPEAYGHRQRGDYVTPAYREEWVYNLGPQTAMRQVVLEDGWVVRVDTLDRGFTPR